MKTIRVFSVPSHQTKERTSGVDFVRVIQPMKYLNGYVYEGVKFVVDIYDINSPKQKTWVEIADEYDIVFLNYTVLDWAYAAMGACVHGKNKKIIMDLDDAIWFLRKDNITYNAISKMKGAFLVESMLRDVDGVTTTNSYLKNIIASKTLKDHNLIRVLPNSIDLSLYNHISKPKDSGEITLLHYGSTTHFEDLLLKEFVDGVDRVLRDFPRVRIKFIGAFIQELKYKWGSRVDTEFGDVDIYGWVKDKFPKFMDEADIIVAPLEDDKYNRAKSDLKFIETASSMTPGVFSHTRPYLETIDNGHNGYIARMPDDWYKSIVELMDVKKRETIGKNAYDYVKKNRTIEELVPEYANFFRMILDK